MLVYRDLRLIPAALSAWVLIAILVGSAAQTVFIWALGLVSAGLAILMLANFHGRRWSANVVSYTRSAGLSGIIVGLILGVLAGHLLGVQNSSIPQLARGEHRVQVIGKVVSQPKAVNSKRFDSGAYRFVLRVERVMARGHTTQANVDIQLMVNTLDPVGLPAYGAIIAAAGNLKPTEPGQAQHARMFAEPGLQILTEPQGLNRVTNHLRADLMRRTEPLSAQARGLVPGAGIGDTSAMPEDLSQAMKTTSLTHITAVSGSHFAIIFMVVSASLWFCPRWLRAMLVAVFMVGFVALVHPEPSVQRAAVMCGVMVFATVLGRPSGSLTSWAVAVLVLLIIDPWLARQFGFVLSVLATGGLIVGTAPIAKLLHNDHQPRWWMPKKLALVLAVPIAAQLACAPILILLEPQISMYSVPANLAATPALVPATLGAVGATLVGPFWPWAGNLMVTIASGATWWIAKVAFFFAGLPGASIQWWPGWPGVIILAGVTVAGLALFFAPPRLPSAIARFMVGRLPLPLQQRLAQQPLLLSQLGSQIKTIGVVMGLLVTLNVVAWLRPPWLAQLGGTSHFGDQWQVASCDVGQGDALLVNLGGGQALMIDTGPPGAPVAHCLRQFGVDTIAVLFLTHLHVDHTGGLQQLLATTKVHRVIGPPAIVAGEQQDQTQNIALLLDRVGLPLEMGNTAMTGSHGQVTWQVLGPTAQLVEQLSAHAVLGGEVQNDSSLVLDVQLGTETTMLFLGDLEMTGQRSLLATLSTHNNPTYDLVKVAHHGSRVQDPALARLLAPSLALFSFGKDNSYGHPHQQTVELFSQIGARAWDTARCGSFGVNHTADGWFVVADCP